MLCIRLSEKFLSFYEELIDAQRFLFYIILSNYVRPILLCWDKHRDISQTWFHVCVKVHCCKEYVSERKTLFGQANIIAKYFYKTSHYTRHRKNEVRVVKLMDKIEEL